MRGLLLSSVELLSLLPNLILTFDTYPGIGCFLSILLALTTVLLRILINEDGFSVSAYVFLTAFIAGALVIVPIWMNLLWATTKEAKRQLEVSIHGRIRTHGTMRPQLAQPELVDSPLSTELAVVAPSSSGTEVRTD